MIDLKLRQEGRVVNHKRVDRLYAEAQLQVKRQRRKKVPVIDRQPLLRPQRRNEVWSADFVFDRTAEGRVVKCLAIVDDATTEAVALVPARAGRAGGHAGARPLSRHPWPSPHAADGQRVGILRPRHADMGARTSSDAAADRTR